MSRTRRVLPASDPSVNVQIRLPRELVQAIDRLRREAQVRPTQSAAIRFLLEKGLEAITAAMKDTTDTPPHNSSQRQERPRC